MSGEPGIVFILDDNASVCRSLQRLFSSRCIEARFFTRSEQLMAALPETKPFCLLLDLNLGTEDGRAVFRKLRQRGCDCPVVFLTAYGDVPTAVAAMRDGAQHFLSKPYEPEHLVSVVREALNTAREQWDHRDQRSAQRALAAKLTPREHQVLGLAVNGLVNKQIAEVLGLAEITVKLHRARAMRRLGARTAAELARFADVLDIPSGTPPPRPPPRRSSKTRR